MQQVNSRFVSDRSEAGTAVSPGGFEFGVQGWVWGEPRPTGITFFLDGSAMVVDQHGRPIRGVRDVKTNKEKRFALTPPETSGRDDKITLRPQFASHKEVIEALEAEGIQWQDLNLAGWPQLPLVHLKKVAKVLPLTDPDELKKIRSKSLRNDALKMRQEIDTLELDDEE